MKSPHSWAGLNVTLTVISVCVPLGLWKKMKGYSLILAILISFTWPALVSTCVQARSAGQRETQIVAPDPSLLRWNLEREADQLVGNSCTPP